MIYDTLILPEKLSQIEFNTKEYLFWNKMLVADGLESSIRLPQNVCARWRKMYHPIFFCCNSKNNW